MGEEHITFADLSDIISKEFKVLEEKIDCKLESCHKELHELAREPIIGDSLDDRDPPRGSALILDCTEQPSSTFACAAGVGPDTKGEF